MNGPNVVCPRCDGLGLARPSRLAGAEAMGLARAFGPVAAECTTCSGRGYIDPPCTAGGRVTLSEIATTPEERARVRRQTRGRRGAALSTRGQQRIQHKQNGPTTPGRRRDGGDGQG